MVFKSQIEFLEASAAIIVCANQMKPHYSVRQFVLGFGGKRVQDQVEMLSLLYTLRLVDSDDFGALNSIRWLNR